MVHCKIIFCYNHPQIDGSIKLISYRIGFNKSERRYGCFYRLGLLFVGVLVIEALRFWVHVLGLLIFGNSNIYLVFRVSVGMRWSGLSS